MGFLHIRKKGEEKKAEEPILDVPADEIQLSSEATAQIVKMAEQEKKQGFLMRVAVMGGGCSGLSLHLSFVKEPQPADRLFSAAGATICVDPKSLSVLGGSTLHYRVELGSGHFVLQNQKTGKSCSCGKSFSL